MKNHILKFGSPILVLLVALLAIQGMDWSDKPDLDEQRKFSQTVNLAMRQAADRLLDLAGDSTQAIPPVLGLSDSEYLLRLENNFSYDSLPHLLEEAFVQFGIKDKYYVTVSDCFNNMLVLGYAQESLNDAQAACGGREQKPGCYNLSVVFPDRATNAGGAEWAWAFLLIVPVAVGGLMYSFKKGSPAPAPVETPLAETPNPALLPIGNTGFDPVNQYVQIGTMRQSLTFREAKLLGFFAQHQNQVLERDAILAAVWEDEGVIVGRSLDVFVSRLRKILQHDPTVKIANVHGVGYRLEV